MLESNITLDEIKHAVWSCAGSKAPRPDGFNFYFNKKFWDLIKVDFLNCFRNFEATGSLARECNPSFFVLIPKIQDPLDISDYRLISLIGCVYKILSKILSRLAKVIHKTIGPNQTAFIAGRQILDGVLIANEVIHHFFY